MTDPAPPRRTFSAPGAASLFRLVALGCFGTAVILIGFDATASHPQIFQSLVPLGLAFWVGSSFVD